MPHHFLDTASIAQGGGASHENPTATPTRPPRGNSPARSDLTSFGPEAAHNYLMSCQPAAASALVLLWKWPANSRSANSTADTAIAPPPPAMRIFAQRLLPPLRLPLASRRNQCGDPHIPHIRRRTLAILPIGHSRCLLS